MGAFAFFPGTRKHAARSVCILPQQRRTARHHHRITTAMSTTAILRVWNPAAATWALVVAVPDDGHGYAPVGIFAVAGEDTPEADAADQYRVALAVADLVATIPHVRRVALRAAAARRSGNAPAVAIAERALARIANAVRERATRSIANPPANAAPHA